jgi:hypothetical protein
MISDGFFSMETQKDGPHRKKNSIRTEVFRREISLEVCMGKSSIDVF